MPIEAPEYASLLNDYAAVQIERGDFVRAEELYQEVFSIWSGPGEHPVDYAVSLHNLGLLYEKQGKYDKAESLLKRDLEITLRVLGEKHPSVAHSLESLAVAYTAQGKYTDAEPLFRQSLNLYRESGGEKTAACARVLNNLGFLYVQIGNFESALPLLQRALELRKTLLGPDHFDTLDSLGDQASYHDAMMQEDEAVRLLQQSLTAMSRNLDLTANVQSERQQIASMEAYRSHLDLYLSLATRAQVDAGELYQQVLRLKGSVFLRQYLLRTLKDEPQLAASFLELRRLASQLATLVSSPVPPTQEEAWQGKIVELTKQKKP